MIGPEIVFPGLFLAMFAAYGRDYYKTHGTVREEIKLLIELMSINDWKLEGSYVRHPLFSLKYDEYDNEIDWIRLENPDKALFPNKRENYLLLRAIKRNTNLLTGDQQRLLTFANSITEHYRDK